MENKRTYFRPTTAQQRQLLFETWETTGNVSEASRKARVCRGTFYYWKERFDTEGAAGLEQPDSHAPKAAHKKSQEIAQAVGTMRREHPDWGKQRISDEMAKANAWVRVVSPNTVKRILKDEGQWPAPEELVKKAKKVKTVVRRAEQAGQTVNVDLCFLPATHEAEQKLPAVSGSSGRLVIERPADENAELDYPGRVFANEALTYAQAMGAFVSASEAQKPASAPVETAEEGTPAAFQAQKRALQQKELELRAERRVVRQQRKVEDQAWEKAKQEQRGKKEKLADRTPQERKSDDELWRSISQKRRETRKRRREANKAWREERNSMRARKSALPMVTAWIAVLVIIDNCTRHCLGLPLFVVGSKVTAAMVVAALRELLPSELQFLISDRGTHFTAKVFQELVRSEAFIHVLTARHRPESNGIAERFVRTLKEWLRDKAWDDDQQLATWVAEFLAEYNDRPHQGLPIPGLSPNEFARRNCSTSS